MDLSRQATRKVKKGLPLESTIRINLPKALEGLGSFFGPVVNPDEPVDFMAPYFLQLKKMEWCRENVEQTDFAHQKALGKLGKYIRRRDNLTESLSGDLVRIRRVCLGVLNEEEFVELGLDGSVSQEPDTILRQGKKVRGAFTDPDLELESPAWVRMKLEAGDVLGNLVSTVERLEAVIKKLADLRRIVQGEAAAKNKALADFDEHHLVIGRSVEACFRMAGMLPEADRVREARRRFTSSNNEEEPAPEEPSEETEADGADDDVGDSDSESPGESDSAPSDG